MKSHPIRHIQDALGEAVSGRRDELPFLIFVSFLITFILSRLTVWMVYHHFLPRQFFLTTHDVHIHHFNYGIILLSIAGFWSLMNNKRGRLYLIAIIYGIGLGLIADEYGILLLLRDNYYARQSYDAVIIVGLLLLSAIFFRPFWRKLGGLIMEIIRG